MTIAAGVVAVTDATAILGPPLASIPVAQAVDQHGLTIAVDRVDVYTDRTLVHVSVTNNSGEKATVYEHNGKLVQASRQFDKVYDSDLPDWQSDILPDVRTSGILRFGAIDPGQPVTVVLTGRNENYRLNFSDYVFATG